MQDIFQSPYLLSSFPKSWESYAPIFVKNNLVLALAETHRYWLYLAQLTIYKLKIYNEYHLTYFKDCSKIASNYAWQELQGRKNTKISLPIRQYIRYKPYWFTFTHPQNKYRKLCFIQILGEVQIPQHNIFIVKVRYTGRCGGWRSLLFSHQYEIALMSRRPPEKVRS